MKERHPMFDALMFAAGRDGLIQWIICPCRTKFNAIVLTKARDRGFVQDDLGHRGEFDNIKRLGCPLADRIETARAVQNVAEQIKPHRTTLARRINVDDAAPDRIIARLHNGWRLRESHANKKISQLFFVDPKIDLRPERRVFQHLTRRHALGCCVQSGQQNELLGHSMHQPRQGRHPCGCNVCIWRHTVIRQTIPARKHDNGHIRAKELQRRLHRRQPLVIARDVQNWATGCGHLFEDQLSVVAFGRATDGDVMLGHQQSSC